MIIAISREDKDGCKNKNSIYTLCEVSKLVNKFGTLSSNKITKTGRELVELLKNKQVEIANVKLTKNNRLIDAIYRDDFKTIIYKIDEILARNCGIRISKICFSDDHAVLHMHKVYSKAISYIVEIVYILGSECKMPCMTVLLNKADDVKIKIDSHTGRPVIAFSLLDFDKITDETYLAEMIIKLCQMKRK